MSNDVQHRTINSRTNSIGDDNAENDISIYATPRPDTPFVTPSSTPRLIHCRLNPVTTVRQHVPLKINFTQKADSATSDQAALSKFNEIKPMNTKKVKCVIQTNPLYQDGDGDQPIATNSKQPVQISGEYSNNSISSHCHPEGDTEPGIVNNDNQLADNVQSVAVIEKEIELMGKFVKDSIERLQKNCDIKTNSDGCDVLPNTNNCDDYSHKSEKNKSEKVSKCTANKNICAQENNLPAGHKCEKKKFYDPEDIRKYMLKKKSERQAKEKEERHKKESEAMALKRKSEATKMLVTKTRIPVLRNHHINEPEVQTENKAKGSRRAKSFCPKVVDDLSIPKQTFLSGEKTEFHRRYSKDLPQADDNRKHTETTNKNEDKVTQISTKVATQHTNTDDLFIGNFNHLINERAGINRKISISEIPPSIKTDLSKVAVTKNKTSEANMQILASSNIPEELDVLKSKNPYNFLNILKGKVNLVKNANDVVNEEMSDDNLLTEAFSPSPSKKFDRLKLDKDQFLDDIIKRRMKMGNAGSLTTKLNDLKTDEESENVEPIKIHAAITPPKNNQTFRVWPTEKHDKTYTVLDNVNKSNVNIISDKSLSLDISGIKSLSPTDKKSSKKLFRKDEFLSSKINAPDDHLLNTTVESHFNRTLTLESLHAHNVSLSIPDSFIKKDDNENCEQSLKNLSVDVRKLIEDESVFRSGIVQGADTSSVIGKTEKVLNYSTQNFGLNESSNFSSDDLTNLSTTAVFFDIYDQMIKTEDEKLAQILRKIHQQKEALNKYLKKEVFALESKKNVYRENKDEEKIKAIKKRQRAVLLKITKNIQELEKMKKSVTETVEKRKTEIMRQKNTIKEKKEFLKQKFSPPKKRKSEGNKTFLISKQTNTLFMGISSSSSTSLLLDNGENEIQEHVEKETENVTEKVSLKKHFGMKDTATSPVNFPTGISIKFELDPEKLLKLKNFGEIKIDPLQLEKDEGKIRLPQSLSHESTDADFPSQVNDREKNEKSSSKIMIKRPLSPVVLPPSRKVSQLRRFSSSSDVTLTSLNDTTTDQSDVELRISALREQLRQRKLEAERLRREEKQLRKEKLRAKEQSLIKQLEAYDQYIQKVTKMLSEDRSVTEVAKPQIKPVTKRPSFVEPTDKTIESANFNKPFFASTHDDNTLPKNKRIFDDLDGENTEDSEKHLRKADSGILIESEVTEVSENIEIRKSKSESEINSNMISDRVANKLHSKIINGASSKSMDNFLQLINDIQSEVVSMSEQVYSSDFVEDIPEDLPDSKSEIENVANYNTSFSVEEIQSDHQYHSDGETKPTSIGEDLLGKDYYSNVHDEVSVKPNEVEIEKPKSESDLSDIFVVKNISDIESSPSDQQKLSIIASEKLSTKDDTNQPSVDEDLQKDNTSKNTAVELTPVEELKIISSLQNTTISEVSPAEEIRTVSSLKNISEEDEPIEKMNLGSFSETPMTEMGDNSVFFDFSQVDHSGNLKSALNEEFIKYESEGSCVADVDEPVRKTDDIQTMMDGLDLSAQINNFTQSEDFMSNDDAEQNFDEMLNNLESYFSVKITSVDEEPEIIPSRATDTEEKNLDEMKIDQKSPEDENVSPIKITELGLEETDVSESLEYDTTPTENSSKQKYNIHCTLSEKNKEIPETDRNEDQKSRESQPESIKSLSAEADRSDEEFLEDYSIPNLGMSTFIVNEDSTSEADRETGNKTLVSSPVEPISEVHSEIIQHSEDLDQKINVDQTPFLEALRRERETLFGQKQEVSEIIASDDLLEKLSDDNYASTLKEIAKSIDLDDDTKEKVNDITDETPITKTETEVDEHEAALKKRNKISNDWLEKELNFNRGGLQEAEELRLQQMRIEQEIEELQAQQQIPPYLYFRDIPNKPPPPYTPPSEHSSIRIPQNETELQCLINPAIHYVCKSLKRGVKIDDIKQLPEYTPNGKSNTEITTYRKFIFDLIKEVARNILENNKTKTCLPWESLSKHKKPKAPVKEEDLPAIIENEILVLFGFRSKINKEKLIIQWSRKKRTDFVDDLLIKELQDEESEWKNYEEDENIIKNQITQNILDDLIQETVDSLQDAFNKKNQFLDK
ncbi:centrosome-associated protein 350-like [Planococcus citri]|uniref:centrosome-associated protein 350-like n=1 Tax=Planococcus citri TaxID=170843 RepID=UPI0031F757E3